MSHRLAALCSSLRPRSVVALRRPRHRHASPWVERAVAAALLASGLLAASPFLTTLRPPLQDLPQHLAAGRVLLEPGHEAFRFREYFEIDWLRSQYLGTYLLLGAFYHPLRWVTDEPLLWANRGLLMSLALAWPVSTELVYRRLLGRSGLGAFAMVLFFNVHLILGFLNFLLGIVACFGALACFVEARARAREGLPRALPLVGWGASSLACFYLHVVPFALLLAVAGLSAAWEGLRPALVARLSRSSLPPWSGVAAPLLAFLPALLAAALWTLTPAGVSTLEAARGTGSRGRAVYQSLETNAVELQNWLVNCFASAWDTRWAGLAFAALALWLLLEGSRAWRSGGAAARVNRRGAEPVPTAHAAEGSSPPGAPEAAHGEAKGHGSRVAAAGKSNAAGAPADRAGTGRAASGDPLVLWALRAFVPLSLLLYFALPSEYAWIWPINARFPVLGSLFLPLWLPIATAPAGTAWRVLRAGFVAIAFGAAGAQALVARDAFAGFAREMRGFDELLATIPEGQRTAALVFVPFSRHVAFAPLLHVGAYYQAERGGVSFFSFADFPQSPVRFRAERGPPRVGPRWEWMPEQVRVDRELAWFDFVITCGGPGRIERSKLFEPAGRFGRFRLFRKRSRRDATPR